MLKINPLIFHIVSYIVRNEGKSMLRIFKKIIKTGLR